MESGYLGQILIVPGLAMEALILAILTTFIAGILPAWRASNMIIVDALRRNQ